MQPQKPQQPTAPATPQKTAKTVIGIILIVYAVITILLGLLTLRESLLIGAIVIGLGGYWLIAGIIALNREPKGAFKVLQTAIALTVGYAGVLLLTNFFLAGSLSGSIVPVAFAVALAILLGRLKKQVAIL